MTFKELKEQLETLTEEQLSQEVRFCPFGFSEELSAKADDSLSLEIADFDLYYYEGSGEYDGCGYPSVPIEELERKEADFVEFSEIKKGMPFFNKSY